MNETEKWGDNVDAAVELALADLKLTRDEVDIEVLEQPSKGFFGIGSKLARVRVTKKKVKEPVIEKEPEVKEEPASIQKSKPETKETRKEKDFKQGHKKSHDHQKFEKRDKRAPRNDRNFKKEEIVPITELDFHKKMDALPVTEDHPALKFLEEVTEQMGLDINMVAKADDSSVLIDISGTDANTIIGKRGQTLDAIQYLTSLVVNKDENEYVKVVVDVENYRARREQTLQRLANRLARKVAKSRRSVKLEPMNPYERKIIHATLQANPNVITRSEGQDPYRRVVIEHKK